MNPNQPVNQSSNGKQEFTDVLLSVNFDTQQEVLKKETGLKIAQKIYSQQGNESDLNFYAARSKRWKELDAWATGKQDNTQFLQQLNVVDATKSYINIDKSPVLVGAQFVSTLVTSMAKNEEYPCVDAVDDGSLTEKERRRMEALYRMNDAQRINQAEEAAGMMFEPPNVYVPDDELAAEVHFKTEDRLPIEIKKEQKLDIALSKCRYQRVMKPKLYFDFITKNFGGTKIDSDGEGGYKIKKVQPGNMLYSYFQSDTGEDELGYIGEVYSLKVRDLRRLFSKSCDERTLYRIASKATQQNVGTGGFTHEWKEEFADYTQDRPWDDMSIPVFDFEIKINVNDYYVSKSDKLGKENISERRGKPNPTSAKTKVHAKPKERWYRGVYAIHGQEMIYWGLPDLVIFPYLNTHKALSSYTINIPMNLGTYTPSLFERAIEPLKEYALTKLKRKQLIAKLRPSGIRIDIESARNVDLGNGNTIAWEEILRIYDTTGTEIYSSRGLNPNERENPAISPGIGDDTVNKILELTNVLAGLIAEIRALIGVPHYRDGSDVGDRTAAKLAEMQNTSSFNVTDHIPNGLNQLMEETLYKCCILEWQKEVKEEKGGIDPSESEVNRAYDISVRMKPTDYQKQVLEQRILQWTQTPDKFGNPLLSPKDVYVIEHIKDFKLAQWYLANIVETNRRKAMEEAEKLDKANSDNNVASAQAANEGAMKLKEMEQGFKMAEISAQDKAKQKQAILGIVADLLKTGQPIPEGFQPLVKLVIENHAIPLMQENKQIVEGIQQEEAAKEQEAAAEEQIMAISEQTGMPPEQVMEQMAAQQQQVA
jgi:hypothetical protein